ncbi:MAG: hypothetical protein FJ090_22865 [Deltaproteobacteria bacterium]|nr:hypothetical protein [Deltaproteobacteria bacterium]
MILPLLLACAGDAADSAGDVPLPGDADYERDPALNVDAQSEAGATNSHNTGEACMHCHQAHSNGPGIFTAAGSAYNADGTPATTGSVQLWDGSADGGTMLLELPIDALGNFYTTTDLGLPQSPVQPLLLDAAGTEVDRMPWPTESASCNQCHTPVIRVAFP